MFKSSNQVGSSYISVTNSTESSSIDKYDFHIHSYVYKWLFQTPQSLVHRHVNQQLKHAVALRFLKCISLCMHGNLCIYKAFLTHTVFLELQDIYVNTQKILQMNKISLNLHCIFLILYYFTTYVFYKLCHKCVQKLQHEGHVESYYSTRWSQLLYFSQETPNKCCIFHTHEQRWCFKLYSIVRVVAS